MDRTATGAEVEWHDAYASHRAGGATPDEARAYANAVAPQEQGVDPTEFVAEWFALRDANQRLVEERAAWIRLFNRLDAAVSKHRTAKSGMFSDDADDALAAAHDRILKSAAAAGNRTQSPERPEAAHKPRLVGPRPGREVKMETKERAERIEAEYGYLRGDPRGALEQVWGEISTALDLEMVPAGTATVLLEGLKLKCELGLADA